MESKNVDPQNDMLQTSFHILHLIKWYINDVEEDLRSGINKLDEHILKQ